MVETTSKSRYTKLEPEALKACKDEIETMRKGVHYFCYTELRPPATIIIFSGFLGIIGTKDAKFCISTPISRRLIWPVGFRRPQSSELRVGFNVGT